MHCLRLTLYSLTKAQSLDTTAVKERSVCARERERGRERKREGEKEGGRERHRAGFIFFLLIGLFCKAERKKKERSC